MIGRLSDIDVRLLRNFVAVVEAGGFSLATARLNVSESTISQQMSDLESRLGMRLCERGRSGFRLTRNGEEVYKATVELLEDMTRFRDRLALLGSEMSGTLNLGIADAIVTFTESKIAEAIRAYVDRSPNISINLHMLTPRDLERGVIEGRLHVAIAPEHRHVAGLAYVPLFSERNSLYCGRGHPLFDKPQAEITLEMLDAGGRISRGYLEHFDRDLFGTERYRATVQLTEAAAILILSGRFIGFLPDHYAAGWISEGRMKAIRPDLYRLEPHFNIIMRKDATADQRVDAFVKEISRLMPKPSAMVIPARRHGAG
jgi:DNA-binding transcriptional LysR family regulator